MISPGQTCWFPPHSDTGDEATIQGLFLSDEGKIDPLSVYMYNMDPNRDLHALIRWSRNRWDLATSVPCLFHSAAQAQPIFMVVNCPILHVMPIIQLFIISLLWTLKSCPTAPYPIASNSLLATQVLAPHSHSFYRYHLAFSSVNHAPISLFIYVVIFKSGHQMRAKRPPFKACRAFSYWPSLTPISKMTPARAADSNESELASNPHRVGSFPH
jgi:hypothetical protein